MFDLFLCRGLTVEQAKGSIVSAGDRYPAPVRNALSNIQVPAMEKVSRMARIEKLHSGMILAEDLRTKTGALVIQKNQEVSDTLRQRLLNFHTQRLLPDEIRVLVYQHNPSPLADA